MVDCASIHPSTPSAKGVWITPNNIYLTSRYSARGWHKDTTNFKETCGCVCVCVHVCVCLYLGGWLSGVEGWEGSPLEGKHQALNEKRVLKMVEWLPVLWLESIRQSSSWPGESSQSSPASPRRLSLPCLPPHKSLLGCVESGQMTSFWQDYPKPGSNLYNTHNTFLQYDKENKQPKRQLDPGVPRKHRPPCCVDHSWQIVSPQSNARVKMRFHYSITLRLFTNTKSWTPSEDHAHCWWIMGIYLWRCFRMLTRKLLCGTLCFNIDTLG